mmetsp:Transcript_59504/g.72838  ORF Transcript_59504/g.72838 Transcript_59504/m.72838 type:complete len:285 (+) Transcript_59504:66-920(+)
MSYGQYQGSYNNNYKPNIQSNNMYQNYNIKPKVIMKPEPQSPSVKSIYVQTKWCAIYLDTQGSNFTNAINDNELSQQIPQTNSNIDTTIEETFIAEINSYIEEESKLMTQIKNGKEQVLQQKQLNKEKLKEEQNDKINDLMSALSIQDRNKAQELLIENNWNVEQAADKAFSQISSKNIFASNTNNGSNNNGSTYGNNINNNQQQMMSEIRIILPDNRQYKYNLPAKDTFWDVYSKLVISVPEYTNKAFTFILPNGHKLSENEFDSTLLLCNLVPKGDIKVQFV